MSPFFPFVPGETFAGHMMLEKSQNISTTHIVESAVYCRESSIHACVYVRRTSNSLETCKGWDHVYNKWLKMFDFWQFLCCLGLESYEWSSHWRTSANRACVGSHVWACVQVAIPSCSMVTSVTLWIWRVWLSRWSGTIRTLSKLMSREFRKTAGH